MAVYHIAGEYTEYYEAFIEADTANIAQQIWYQNTHRMQAVDTNIDVHVEDEDLNEEPDYTMEDYDPDGGKIAV